MDQRDVEHLYRTLDAPVVAFDCGEKCAPNNGGVPFCCDDRHAIPVLYDAELAYVLPRTKLWRGFRPRNAHERKLSETLGATSRFARCAGHTACERGYRSFSCRSFPFFPYLTREGDLIGLAYYWDFRDRCWIHNQIDLVEPDFIRGFFASWEQVLYDPDEHEAYRDLSAVCRRVHTRWKRAFYVIDRDGEPLVRRPGESFLIPRRMLRAAQLPEAEEPMRPLDV